MVKRQVTQVLPILCRSKAV